VKNLTTLFLVRHGETEWNLANRLQGQYDSPLTPLGVFQAKKLQQRLLSKNIHIAYSSPLLRALETTALIIADRPVKLLTRDNLAEMRLGPWQGKTYKEIEKSYPREFLLFNESPHQYQLLGAETFIEIQQRVMLEIKKIFRENIGRKILVVSHGIAIRACLAHVLQKTLAEMTNMAVINNGDFITLEYENDCIAVV